MFSHVGETKAVLPEGPESWRTEGELPQPDDPMFGDLGQFGIGQS